MQQRPASWFNPTAGLGTFGPPANLHTALIHLKRIVMANSKILYTFICI